MEKLIYYEPQHELAGERKLNNTSGYISPIYLRYFYEFNIWYNLYAIITNFRLAFTLPEKTIKIYAKY